MKDYPSVDEVKNNSVTWEDVKPGMWLIDPQEGDYRIIILYIINKSESKINCKMFELDDEIKISRSNIPKKIFRNSIEAHKTMMNISKDERALKSFISDIFEKKIKRFNS